MGGAAKASPEKVAELATSLVYKKLQSAPLSLARVEEACDALASRYKVKVDSNAVLKALQARGCVVEDGMISIPGTGSEDKEQEIASVKSAAPLRVTEIEARRLAEQLGIFVLVGERPERDIPHHQENGHHEDSRLLSWP